MSRRRLARALALATAAGAANAAVAGAAPRLVSLPSPTSAVRVSPPLQTNAPSVERRVPGRIHANVDVRVVLGPDGEPVRVTALDRLLLVATGDYSFSVPAPALDAVPSAASASAPGLRTGAVLWQGFVSKQRLLGALITLRPGPAAPSLPLRFSLGRGRLEIRNATATRTSAATAKAAPAAVAARLDATHAAVAAGQAQTSATLPAFGPIRTVAVTAVAPARVRGIYRFGAGPDRRLTTVVGRRPLEITGSGPLTRLQLTAEPVPRRELLRPPRRATWKAYAAVGGLGPEPVLFAARRLLGAAVATQYEAFLANPDPFGPSRTTYRFALRAAPLAAGTGSASSDAGGAWIGLAVGLGLLALAGGLVLWAHS
jgi:hypothetical protein